MTTADAISCQARKLLRAEHAGFLSTLSEKLGGHPFGTMVSCLTDQEARPIFLISQLAEHTRNIRQDARVSLLVHEQSNDVQAGERLTIVGQAVRMETTEALKTRYLRYFPGAEQYLALDFSFYRLEPTTLRYIGGPGIARWISPGDMAPPQNSLAAEEEEFLVRFNRDQAGDLQFFCRAYYGLSVSGAALVGIDCDGFDIMDDGQLLRFDFPYAVTNAKQAEAALLELIGSCT
ncbi:MAG TPA: pyridoxamine 5'-phosphate oxidase family protein [Sulfuricella sp.]|nr:pyridoxamine 5'-phosphate oxidase family protein [Sulfuricella sp.]